MKAMGAIPEPLPAATRVTSMNSSQIMYTEAVPLSLSSLAHASLPLEDGVLDGVNQVLSHTLLSCVNYARVIHPPHQWTFSDLTTSKFAWMPTKASGSPEDLPFSLTKLKFQHFYQRRAGIYLRAAMPTNLTAEAEAKALDDWQHTVGLLGIVKLMYASTEPLTSDELNGTDTEDIPPTILYKVIVEYRSLPPTGKAQAVQAEELSMLSFGGSVDDDVKYGALASLYDSVANYVLEIYSVRGKKYKFDLMDATLSNGTVPRLPSQAKQDAFCKSLCATVTDHTLPLGDADNKKYAITRMHLTLEGKIRVPMTELPPIDSMANSIATHFRCLNTSSNVAAAQALPSGHTLLLDPAYAGRIYVNGRYITTWGQDVRIGSHGVALFGMDLHSIPVWHGRVVDFEALKRAYGQMWHEILVDARLWDHQIGAKLLSRLMYGKDPPKAPEEDDDDDDSDYEYDDGDDLSLATVPCLEAQVLSDPEYDLVGVAAKALGTRFMIDFGRSAYPCRACEVQWVKRMLVDKTPVVVPDRIIPILRRGGFFDVQRAHDEQWFVETRPPDGEDETKLVEAAMQCLASAGCADDVAVHQIVVAPLAPMLPHAKSLVSLQAVCRFQDATQLFSVHPQFIKSPWDDLWESETDGPTPMDADNDNPKAALLALSIAQAHPDGRVLTRYLLSRR